MPFPQSFSLRPTGADNTYRRLDYLRGSAVSILVAALMLLLSLVGFGNPRKSDGPLMYVSFAGVLLGLVSLAAAIIFGVQAGIGSPEAVSFALPEDYVPLDLRDRLRAILVNVWNPQQRQPRDDRAYDSYLSIAYVMGSRNLEPEEIASRLEELEATDGLLPGSNEVSRFRAAEQILELVVGRPLNV
jgi:hypothetical protein